MRVPDRSNYLFTTEVNEQDAEALTDRLIAFNNAHLPGVSAILHEEQPLHIFIHDRGRHLVGGLIGRMHAIPDWLEISILWIDEPLRGQGLGRELMARAEEQARQQGCRFARLATSHYQAPEFYQKLGYEQYGKLEDCPPGETVFYLRKTL